MDVFLAVCSVKLELLLDVPLGFVLNDEPGTVDSVDCVDYADVASSQTVVAYVSVWSVALTWVGVSVTSLGYLLLAFVTGTDTEQQACVLSVVMLDYVDLAVTADDPVSTSVDKGYVVEVLTSADVTEMTLQHVEQD